MITIYHNPRCTKSRAALKRVQQYAEDHELAVNVIDYLNHPLNDRQLSAVQKQLGAQVSELVREHDGLTPKQQRDLLVAQPELMQRPIISYGGRAVIARPTELLDSLLV